MTKLIKFRDFIFEYELTDGVIPSHVSVSDVKTRKDRIKDLGTVDGHRIEHHQGKHTFIIDHKGETVGHIGHKKTNTARMNRVALSAVTKKEGSSFSMGNVLHHMIKHHGFILESDNTNTEKGAHRMLMNLAKRQDIHTHIENGYGEKVHHTGDITSPENQKLYTTKHTDSDFMEDNKHKRILVFRQKHGNE